MIDIAGGTRVSIFGLALCLAVFGLLLPAAANDKNRPKTMIPAPTPNPARAGCHLSGELYDYKTNVTRFSYDCDVRQPDGLFGYIEYKPGNYFKNKG